MVRSKENSFEVESVHWDGNLPADKRQTDWLPLAYMPNAVERPLAAIFYISCKRRVYANGGGQSGYQGIRSQGVGVSDVNQSAFL